MGDNDPQYYNLKRFNEESKPLNFARKLLEEYAIGGAVEVEFESPSENMPKYLTRIGIEGELRKVFFGKSRKNTILFKGKKITLQKKKIKNFNLILKQIREKHQKNGFPIFNN